MTPGLPPEKASPCWLLLAPLREAVLAVYVPATGLFDDDLVSCWFEAADWAGTDYREPIPWDAIVAWEPAHIPKEVRK